MSGRCGVERQKYFYGEFSLEEFCAYIFNLNPKKEGSDCPSITCIAHNGSGYDSYFILNYILKEGNKPPELVTRGGKILQMKLPMQGFTFID